MSSRRVGAVVLALLLAGCGGAADEAAAPSSPSRLEAPAVVALAVDQASSGTGEPLCVDATGTVSPASDGRPVELVRGGVVLSTVTTKAGAFTVHRCSAGFGPQETFTARTPAAEGSGASTSAPVQVDLLASLGGVGYH